MDSASMSRRIVRSETSRRSARRRAGSRPWAWSSRRIESNRSARIDRTLLQKHDSRWRLSRRTVRVRPAIKETVMPTTTAPAANHASTPQTDRPVMPPDYGMPDDLDGLIAWDAVEARLRDANVYW